MTIKFASFESGYVYNYEYKALESAECRLNKWLEKHPKVEILNWHTCAVGEDNRLCITIEYREGD